MIISKRIAFHYYLVDLFFTLDPHRVQRPLHLTHISSQFTFPRSKKII